MGKSYQDKLKDPRWQRRRLEIMQRDDFQCQMCFSREDTLTVHHKEYIKGLEPWEYEDKHLITLCECCHKKVHINIDLEKNGMITDSRYFGYNMTDWTIFISMINRINKVEGENSIKTIIQLLTSYCITMEEL